MDEVTDTIKRAHVFIDGRVQGVGFRHFVKTRARTLNLVGWVKNLRDGRVEAVFEGDGPNVEELIDLCRQGPPASRVDHMDINREEPRENFNAFKVAF